MVVGNEVHLITIGVEVTLSRVPVMNVVYRGIERTLHIERAIALRLVATLVLSIEDIEVVSPNMLVVGVEAHTVFWMKHNGKVSELHITAIPCYDAKAIESSIVSNALKGKVHCLTLSLHLQTDSTTAKSIHITRCQSTENADGKRALLTALFISLQNVLQSSACLELSFVYLHFHRDGLGSRGSDIKDASTRFQPTIIIIGTNACCRIMMSITTTREGTHLHHLRANSLRGCLHTLSHWHHLQHIATGRKSESIYPSIRAIRAHKLSI